MSATDPPLEVGVGVADITPAIGTTLSGFIFRENQPSRRVDDPLQVSVLALRQDAEQHLLISYEVLGISEALQAQVLERLENALGESFDREKCILLATHTHSAPPVKPLEGEADPDPAYLQQLIQSTVEAAQNALQNVRPATCEVATISIPDLTYNRRAVLDDGRVTMARHPDRPVVERGPVDDRATFLVWRGERGEPIASAVHFACHGVALCTQAISGDIPGCLSNRIGELLGAPCIFLQGAAGDINPTTVSADRPEMLAWVEQFTSRLDDLSSMLVPFPCAPLRAASAELDLRYQPLPDGPQVRSRIEGYERIAQGDLDAPSARATLHNLGNIMNFEPGQSPDPHKAGHAARALASAQRRVLAAIRSGQPPHPRWLHIDLWRLGDLRLVFVAAEIFAATGLKIRNLSAPGRVLPVTYAGPLVGYIPDGHSQHKGGYEVDSAWQFYRQPAPFEPDSEARILSTVESLLAQV